MSVTLRDKKGRFVEGNTPWLKGTKGLAKKNKGSFKKGQSPWNKGLKGYKAGENSPRWKGGRRKNPEGYIVVSCGEGKAKFEHKLVIQKYIGREIKMPEQTHHINKIKDDNRPENLIAFKDRKSHCRFEKGLDFDETKIIFDGRKLIGGF